MRCDGNGCDTLRQCLRGSLARAAMVDSTDVAAIANAIRVCALATNRALCEPLVLCGQLRVQCFTVSGDQAFQGDVTTCLRSEQITRHNERSFCSARKMTAINDAIESSGTMPGAALARSRVKPFQCVPSWLRAGGEYRKLFTPPNSPEKFDIYCFPLHVARRNEIEPCSSPVAFSILVHGGPRAG